MCWMPRTSKMFNCIKMLCLSIKKFDFFLQIWIPFFVFCFCSLCVQSRRLVMRESYADVCVYATYNNCSIKMENVSACFFSLIHICARVCVCVCTLAYSVCVHIYSHHIENWTYLLLCMPACVCVCVSVCACVSVRVCVWVFVTIDFCCYFYVKVHTPTQFMWAHWTRSRDNLLHSVVTEHWQHTFTLFISPLWVADRKQHIVAATYAMACYLQIGFELPDIRKFSLSITDGAVCFNE